MNRQELIARARGQSYGKPIVRELCTALAAADTELEALREPSPEMVELCENAYCVAGDSMDPQPMRAALECAYNLARKRAALDGGSRSDASGGEQP